MKFLISKSYFQNGHFLSLLFLLIVIHYSISIFSSALSHSFYFIQPKVTTMNTTNANATLSPAQIEAQIAASLPMITKSLYRYVGDNAEDVAMDSIIKALEKVADYNGKAAVSTWVYQIARNTAIDYIRKHKPIYTGDAVFLENVGGSYTIDDAPDFNDLHVAIAALSAKHQEVIRLHYFDGLKYKEIAEVIGKPIGTVMSRLSQAKLKLNASPLVTEDGW